jgi:hypothetical protein
MAKPDVVHTNMRLVDTPELINAARNMEAITGIVQAF